MDFIDNSQLFIDELNRKLETVMTAVGQHLVGEAGDELENAPRRIDTGNLRRSIECAYVAEEKAEYIGTNVEYAPYVHEGTSKMAPNRFLRNAVERNQKQIKEYIINGLKS